MTVRPLAPEDPPFVGRYRIVGELGSGGMGRVLLGTGPDGRLVAVKQVHAHLLHEVEYRSRFRREVEASTRVSGSFTAPVIDFDVDSEIPWLASVFVVGLPLDKAVSAYGPLPPEAVLRLAAGLASALRAIHGAELIHRDLKPANVLLAADGPRVIDFGIASMTENPAGLTETGSVLGSPAYMSPEQTLSEPLSSASDVFSLGSVLVMAATGTAPFTAASLAYTLFNIAHTQPNLEALPPELRTLIEPCLHKDPNARPTPAQILDFLGDPLRHGTPWPEPVHREIDRQHTELVALTADPNATSVLPGGRRFHRSGRRPPVDIALPRRKRGTRTAALIGFAVLAVVAIAVSAAVWMRGGGAPATAAPRVLTLAQVRAADTCAWLKAALAEPIPNEIAQNFPADVSAWSFAPDWYRWGCTMEASGRAFYLNFDPDSYLTPTDVMAVTVPEGSYGAGRPILGDEEASSTCHRAITTPELNGWGLSVSTSARYCDQAEYILLRLAAVDEIPRLPDATASLAAVDPCALADPASLLPLIGAVPESPAEVFAHSCTWEGSASVEISTRRTGGVGTDDPTIDLGGGRQLIAPTSTVASICEREYVFRATDRWHEVLQVRVQGNSDSPNESVCATAESAARTAIDRLPS
ncbi:serine/threonine-protein kinase [Nocardia sp. CC227C]|uniref:serine/threonine-protein kinase n=1 Tax=Nocardia sp. CC227C TaxID=3044562 RepID=UPI00278BD20C|nr:serine/threonine-protein kinase [Nocardia sp. CC227C]